MEHRFNNQPTEPLALSTLLSQALVAFIIEFDNEFEHQIPHRTTNHGTTPGAARAPWLVSMVMWTRFLQFVPRNGITIGSLQPLVGLSRKGMQLWLTRLSQWWGICASYLVPPILGPLYLAPSGWYDRIAPRMSWSPLLIGAPAVGQPLFRFSFHAP